MFLLGAWRTAEPSDDQVRDAIDRLVYSMRSSILIEDRRDAVKKLLSVSRRYPMPVLQVLKDDYEDEDMVKAICDIIETVTADELGGRQFAEIACKDRLAFADPLIKTVGYSNSALQARVIEILNLVTGASDNALRMVQRDFLSIPESISVLCRCLEKDSVVLPTLELLEKLSGSGAQDIQRMAVFGGAAERAILVAAENGGVLMGGMTAGACYSLTAALVAENYANQEYLINQPAFTGALYALFDHDKLHDDKQTANEKLAWRMVSALLSLDGPKLKDIQAALGNDRLFKTAIYFAIVLGSEEAAEFLCKLLHKNEGLRARFMREQCESHSAVYLLIRSTLAGSFHLLAVFAALLFNAVDSNRWADGQITVASTLAPGAESPGLLIIEQLVQADGKGTAKDIAACKTAYHLLSYVLYDNEQVKTKLADHAVDQNECLLQRLTTNCLFLSSQQPLHDMDPGMILAGLGCMAVWYCGDGTGLCAWVLREMGGVVQCLLERVLWHGSKDIDRAVSGLSAFLLGLFMHESPGLIDIIKSRIGSDLFVGRLDALCDSPITLDRHLLPHPIIYTFRARYPQIRSLLSPVFKGIDPRDDIIRTLRLQLGDADGSQTRFLLSENERIRRDNAALLEQLVALEDEKTEHLEKIGALEEQLSDKQRGLLKSIKNVIGMEQPAASTHATSPGKLANILNI